MYNDFSKVYKCFEDSKELGLINSISLCGLIIDYVSVKYDISRKELLEMLATVNEQVNDECGEMKI